MHTDVAVSFAKRIQTGREGRTEANKDESAISLIRIAKLQPRWTEALVNRKW